MKRRSFSPFALALLLSALVLSMIPVCLAWADEELEDPPLAIEESASSDDEEANEDELSAQSDHDADADEGEEVPDEQPVATNPKANPIEEAAPDGLVAMAATNIQQLPDAPYRNNIWPLSDGENFAYAVYDSSANTVTVKRYNITNGDSSTLKTFSGYLRFGTYYAVNDKLYYTASTFRSWAGTNDPIDINTLDLISGETTTLFSTSEAAGLIMALGVDASGRVYVYTSDWNLYVFSPTGEKLAFCDDISIECFAGFDESNGNFYYYGTTNWVYWGYDHTMQTLEVGNLNGSTITHGSSYVTMLYQCYFHDHYGCVELFADKYLASLSTFYGGDLVLFDSDSIKPSDVSSEIETVELDNGVSVSSVALPKKTILNAWGTSNRQTVDIGSRSAYVEGLDAIAVAAGAQEVVLYDTSDWEPIAKVDAAASIHRIMTVGDHLVLIELNDDSTYSVESFNCSTPTRLDISGSTSVEVGSCPDYTLSSDSDLIPQATLTTSDPSILSIDNEGKAAAWKAGTVTLTAKMKDGLSSTLRVTVSGTGVTAARDEVTTLAGSVPSNCNYYEGIEKSYIVENGQGFMLVDASSGDLEIQYRDASGKLTSKKTVKHELEYFGGFFKGEDAYYVAYGATNYDESDDTTVVRVVKYDTSWKRLAACDLKGANTTWAFRAGSVSMDEGAGKLIVHTCHQMYQSGDGYRHQANMTLKIDEASMKLLDSYTDVMNLSEGYVSHSFDEIVRVVDGKIYRADRGDAYPRGLAFTITPLENELGDPTVYTTLAEFSGNIGANYTGSTLGGMEVSESGALVAYGEDVEYGDFTRDVKLAVYDESSGNVTVKKLTSYTSGGNVKCLNMKLVRLNGRHFLLMWAEQNTSTNRITTRIARLDQHGNVIGDIVERRYMNSDCQPILLSDGNVAWYAADSWGRELYTINPYDLTAQIAWPFKDVSIATPHREDICWLAAQGISTGWGTIPNATFRPYDTVKRADMAAFIFRLAKLWGAGDASDSWQPNSSTRSMFLDVNEDTPHAREIWWLAEKGISMGWDVSGGKEFRPYANVARADLAAFLGRLAKLAGRGQSVTPARSFADVTSSTAHHDEIWWMAGAGISTGWDENGTKTFRPLNDVKRCDTAAFLRRMDKLS